MSNETTPPTDDVLVLRNQNAELNRRIGKLSKDLEESRAAHRGTHEEHAVTMKERDALQQRVAVLDADLVSARAEIEQLKAPKITIQTPSNTTSGVSS